jgi:hypothetical protein
MCPQKRAVVKMQWLSGVLQDKSAGRLPRAGRKEHGAGKKCNFGGWNCVCG